MRKSSWHRVAERFPVMVDFHFSPWHVADDESRQGHSLTPLGESLFQERHTLNPQSVILLMAWPHTLRSLGTPACLAYPAYLRTLYVEYHSVPSVAGVDLGKRSNKQNKQSGSIQSSIASTRIVRQFRSGVFRPLSASFCPRVRVLHILQSFLNPHLDQRIVTSLPFMPLARRCRRR
jgi:hypothetical protein